MENINKFRFSSIDQRYTLPVVILNVLNTSYNIDAKLHIETFNQLLLPLCFESFSGPLIANLTFPYFNVSKILLSGWFIGCSLYFLIKNINFAKKVSKLGPLIGKTFMLCDMKNSKVEIQNLLFWIFVNSFIGSVVHKVITKEKDILILNQAEATDVFCSLICLLIARYFNLDDVYVGLMVLICFFIELKIAIDYSASKKNDGPSDKQKKTKRKASQKAESKLKENKINEDSFFSEEGYLEEETEGFVSKTNKRRGRPRKNESAESGVSETPTRRKSYKKKSDLI